MPGRGAGDRSPATAGRPAAARAAAPARRPRGGGPVSSVLHLIAGRLPAVAPDEPRLRGALELGGALGRAPGVRAALLGRSEGHIVSACWLDDRDALEPFAASPPHMAFVVRGLAPLVSGMWSASIEADAPPPPSAGAVAMWAMAVPERAGIFEWEVRALLAAVAALPGEAASGPTVEERDRFRAGAVILLRAEERERFDAALREARDAWPRFASEIEEALVGLVDAPGGPYSGEPAS